MSWVKIDDHLADHPKVAQLGTDGPKAMWLYVAGLCYASRYLTDGFIPRNQIVRLADLGDVDEFGYAAMLVDVGLWEEVDGGYTIHDYLTYNPSREHVLAERERAKARRSPDVRRTFARRSPDVRPNVSGPVPVPVPDVSKETSDARERADVEAFLLVRRRLPTPAQRKLMDAYCRTFDVTGLERAERLILAHPDDPIGALKADLDAFRKERLAALPPEPVRKPSRPRGLTGVNAELAALLRERDDAEAEERFLKSINPDPVTAAARSLKEATA